MFKLGQYKFIIANSASWKRKIYRLRYETYVREFGFERPEDHPHGIEVDEYDDHSVHFAVCNGNGNIVGTIRLILYSEKGFPVEHVTNPSFIGEKPNPQKIAEISRFAISNGYRRRRLRFFSPEESSVSTSTGVLAASSIGYGYNGYNGYKKPIIMTGLYKIVYQTSKRLGITHWYMITEDRIYRILKKFGFRFHQIGKPINYHGLRAPYLGIISEIEERLANVNPQMLIAMAEGLEDEYWPEIDWIRELMWKKNKQRALGTIAGSPEPRDLNIANSGFLLHGYSYSY